MRIKSAILLMLVFLMSAATLVCAEAGRQDDAARFERAVELLKQVNQPESVRLASEAFGGIASNYNDASLFKGYADMILQIHAGDLDGAESYCQVLSDHLPFQALAQEYGLPTIATIRTYLMGRRAENEGRLEEAFSLYLSIDFLDAVDRSLALRDAAYEQRYADAIALFDAGLYQEALNAFQNLGNYRDSEAWARRLQYLLTAPTEAPMPEVTPPPEDTSSQIPQPSSGGGWDIVTFGSYEQDGNPDNGPEPIEWLLLKVEGNRGLLLSLYALEVMPYDKGGRADWSGSALRSWLNGDFASAAFGKGEREWIFQSPISNAGRNAFGVDGGADTEDAVFLLNTDAAYALLTDPSVRACRITRWAAQRGARTNDSGLCWWWLRTPGSDSRSAAYVSLNGMIVDGGVHADTADVCVRPALWVKLRDE